MQNILQQFQVSFEYPVCFTKGLFESENPLFKETITRKEPEKRHRLLIVIDERVLVWHPDLLQQIKAYIATYPENLQVVTPPLVFKGGEKTKDEPFRWKKIQELIDQHEICRHSFVVAIGGGALLDMVGFAVATPHRGVRLVRVPTTVLSQNDSGIGVKNAVNARGKKNFFGTFVPPFAVLNDLNFLQTLEPRDWMGGVSEAIKVALLKDSSFFELLEEIAEKLVQGDLEQMGKVVYRCAKLHLEHIRNSGDAFEMYHSRPLDFGHWSAHKLEMLSRYRVRHGEAVAAGIALDCYYSHLQGKLSEQELRRILALFKKLGLSIYYEEMAKSELLLGLDEFREHLGGDLNITLIQGIGKPWETNEMQRETIIKAIELLREEEEE